MPIANPREEAATQTGGIPIIPPRDEAALRNWLSLLAVAVNALARGRLDSVIEVTLDANSATTTVTNELITPNTVMLPMPVTANAGAELGAGALSYLTTTGAATITHANNTQTDRTFRFALIG